jgi:hypothetical protein
MIYAKAAVYGFFVGVGAYIVLTHLGVDMYIALAADVWSAMFATVAYLYNAAKKNLI